MLRLVNYIRDLNRWHLSAPPAWWQQQLFDFDPLLVLIPSRQFPFYRLTRRSRVKIDPNHIWSVAHEADTHMMAQYSVVPVTTVIRHGGAWQIDNILRELRARDVWSNGGAEKIANALDEKDEKDRQKVRAQIRSDMDHRSRDAWRSYQARTGQRTRPTTGQIIAPSSSGRTPGRVEIPSTDRPVAR
jgi:hypothetical protein